VPARALLGSDSATAQANNPTGPMDLWALANTHGPVGSVHRVVAGYGSLPRRKFVVGYGRR
jgi:hypothetical protein